MHTAENLRACILALYADEGRGHDHKHLDNLLAELALKANHHDALVEASKLALDFIHSMPYEPSRSPSTKVQDALVDALRTAGVQELVT